jgi:type 1 glutamine amidotransferase
VRKAILVPALVLAIAGLAVSFSRTAVAAANPAVPAAEEQGIPRVLLVTGGHDHDASFYTVFEERRRLFRTNVDPHPVAFRRELRKHYDVIVLYDSVSTVPDNQKKNLQDFVEAGKGLVVLHHAIVDFPDWPWWYREVVGGKYLLKAEEGLPASTYKHDVEFLIEPVGEHPITAGIRPFRIIDEGYKNLWISDKVKVILKTENKQYADGPFGWISPYPKSRVVYLKLGHDRKAHDNPSYRDLVTNAILWAAGKK